MVEFRESFINLTGNYYTVIIMREIFSTSSDSKYYLNSDRTWTRVRNNGERYEGMVYVGSIDPSRNPAFSPFDIDEIYQQLIDGNVPGFEPSFIVGYAPLGVKGCRPGDIVYGNGRLIRNTNLQIMPHVGHEITEIHEEGLVSNQNWMSARLIKW